MSGASRSDPEAGRRSSGRKSRSIVSTTSEDYAMDPSEKCHCEICKARGRNAQYYKKMIATLQPQLMQVLELLTDQEEDAIFDLRELVRFKSISVEPNKVSEGLDALDWVLNRLSYLKFRVRMIDVPNQSDSCAERLPGRVLFANYFSSPTKCTLLVYGHVDVLPPEQECWLQDPFELALKEDKIYGRGVTKGKGMLIGWIQAIECWLKINEDLPINIKFIVEMLHEVGSTGLQQYVKERSEFFLDVDFMLFDANSWLNEQHPVIPCSLTGRAYFGLSVHGGNKSVETGLAGGLVFEPLIDLCHLMNSLVDDGHEIKIPNVEQNVKHLAGPDWQLLENSEFSSYKYKDTLQIRRLKHEENKVEMLRSRWCRPALTMHGVDGSDARSDCSPSIPMQVTGKFSIKLVPDQEVEQVNIAVTEYLDLCSRDLNMGTLHKLSLLDSCDPISWRTDSRITKATRDAVRGVFSKEPYLTTAIPICLPVANAFYKMLKKPLILLPYYKRLDRHQLENEHIQEVFFERHAKVCAALLFELAKIPVGCKCNLISEYCNLQGVAEKLTNLEVTRSGSDTTIFQPRPTKLKFKRKDPNYKVKNKKPLWEYFCPSFGFRWRNKSKKRKKAKLKM